VEAVKSDEICSAILDWIDKDDNISINGAESSYYQTLNPPYYAKNAPMDDLSELLLVRGVTREMYEGTDVTNRAPGAFQNRDRFGRIIEGPIHTTGLKDIFTTLSASKKINFNTTSAEVLQALGFDEPMALDLIRQRDEAPFKQGDFNKMPPQLKAIVDSSLDVKSSIFEVQVIPKSGGFKRRFYAIIGPGNIGPGNSPREMQVLSFYWKWNE
jgi:type II secretory pathway component PulK